MGVLGESLSEEYLITGTDHTAVVQVDVVDKEPGADTVVRELATLLGQLHDILIEEQAHLVFGVGGKVMCRGIEEVAEPAVTYFIESALGQACLYI